MSNATRAYSQEHNDNRFDDQNIESDQIDLKRGSQGSLIPTCSHFFHRAVKRAAVQLNVEDIFAKSIVVHSCSGVFGYRMPS